MYEHRFEHKNHTRLIEVDAAKTFAIIYMVVVHVYERMSVVDSDATLPDSVLRNIIEFAGLSFLLMGLLKKAQVKPFWIVCLALLMQATGTWLGLHMDQENPMNMFFGLFVYVGNASGFALMLWFVYPATGMLFAEIMKNVQDRDCFYKRALVLSAAVIISMVSILPLIDYDIRNTYANAGGIYYQQNMYSFLFTLSVVLIALALSYFVFHGLEHTIIGRFIKYCSANLTTIYVFQWLLIIYGFLFMMIIGSELISLEAVIPVGLIITAASIGLSALWNRARKSSENFCSKV